jgi:hypothetical protein
MLTTLFDTFCCPWATILRCGGYRPHDEQNDAKRCGQRKTNQTPHPVARDGSGIPFLRDHISVASLGPFGASYMLVPVAVPPCLSRLLSLPVSLSVVGNRSDMVVAAKYTVASGHACVGCVLWRSGTAFGASPSLPSILLSETPLVTG